MTVGYVDGEEQEDETEECVDAVLDVMTMTGSYLLHVEVGALFPQNLPVADLEE